MPMSSSRATVDGQSLVCSVVSTRWPVSAARMPICGGLQVARLADQDDVGVLAQEAAQAAAKVRPISSLTWHLVDALEVVLDRVLGGHDVDVRGVDRVDRRVERGGLAGAGRAR